jgi:hypothetical protein
VTEKVSTSNKKKKSQKQSNSTKKGMGTQGALKSRKAEFSIAREQVTGSLIVHLLK